MLLRSRRRLLLVGEGRVADLCASSLQNAPERLTRRNEGAVGQADLRAADLVIIVEPKDLGAWLAPLAQELGPRAGRKGLPRLVVIEDAVQRHRTASAVEAASALPPAVRIERVSIPQRAARQLLARWPLHWAADTCFGQQVHLLIFGAGAFAEALLIQALRIGQYGEQRLQVTVLSSSIERFQRDFEAAYPNASEIADIRFGRSTGAIARTAVPVTMAVICAEPPEAALEQALRLKERLASERQSPPLLLDVGDRRPAGELADWDGQLVPVSRFALALARDTLLDGQGDALAQVIHEHYRDTTEAQGRDPSSEPAGRSWELLASSYREANRHQADHVWAKLAATDCRAVPEERVDSFAFAPIEVERLAMIEHARWAADRWLDGWSYAPERDNRRKHHPQLIPYAALSGPMKDLDRFAVRLVPTLLARSGLGVLRMLMVGIRSDGAPASKSLEPLLRRALARLVARYPDRALIVAASASDAEAMRCVRLAVDSFGAGFFLLLDSPLPSLLEDLAPPRRLQTLALLSRAERRIQLAGSAALRRWLDDRAEILIELGDGSKSESGDEAPADRPLPERKQVRIDPAHGLDWSFEY